MSRWGRGSMLAPLFVAAACSGAGELSPFGSGNVASGGGSGAGTLAAGSDEASGDTTGAAATGGGSGGSSGPPGGSGIVYVRCVRTLDALEVTDTVTVGGMPTEATKTFHHLDIYDELPASARYTQGFVAPCDLMLQRDDGSSEVLYSCTDGGTAQGVCAALDPAVSHDGREIAFSVFRGPIEYDTQRPSPRVLHIDAVEEAIQYVDMPNPRLIATEAQLHIVDVASGAVTQLPHTAATFDSAPTFLADGRLVFTSNRRQAVGAHVRFNDATWRTVDTAPQVPQLYVMDPVGRDVAPLSSHGLSGEFYPYQLQDGRIAHLGRQLFGMLPYRYTNGSPGQPGAVSGTYQLFAMGPDGTLLTPLFGSHTHLAGSPTHAVANRMAQTADGRLWYAEGGGSVGAGNIHAFTPRMDFVTGPGPADAPVLADLFRPEDFFLGTTWAGNGGQLAAATPAPEVMLDGYDDALAYQGFVRDPDAHPDGGLVLTWAKGGCSPSSRVDEELFGSTPLPSGNVALTGANLLEELGWDTPGCDAGIYRTTVLPSAHPGDLEAVIDTVEFHEIMPRVLATYDAVHGTERPAVDPEPAVDEPSASIEDRGSPFGTLLLSSLLDRETRSVSGHPFGGETAWALQGTDTGDYSDDDICGLRVLAVQPNVADAAQMRAPAGHRTLLLGEVAARKLASDGGVRVDESGAEDTSMHIEVPANVPLLLQTIDCEGRTLNTSQTPLSLRPGEVDQCHGCHRRSEAGLALSQTAAGMGLVPPSRLGEGTVSLFAGGDNTDVATETQEGWGIALEYDRDVVPILEGRCMPCHDGTNAEAGLVLDQPGVEPGSTWWTLVADFNQAEVPIDRRAPTPSGAGLLRKPQLTRYVRFMDARGSLLYWKAANARTDGRTDADFADDATDGFADVDFGAAHPTDITAAELAILGRWIDSGAGAGGLFLEDSIPPTLAASVDLDGGGSTLTVGTVDVGAGIDAQSLEICILTEQGACESVAAPAAAEAGQVTVELATQDVEREVRIEVRDRAGNATVVRRTIGTLAGADLASGATGAGGSDGTGGSGEGDGTEGGADGGGDDDGGGGCRVGGRAAPAALALLLVAAWRRRRDDR